MRNTLSVIRGVFSLCLSFEIRVWASVLKLHETAALEFETT